MRGFGACRFTLRYRSTLLLNQKYYIIISSFNFMDLGDLASQEVHQVMKKNGLHLYVVCSLLILATVGCSPKTQDSRLHIIKYQSDVLGKEMISQVYVPVDYDETKEYPILYFLPSSGGSSYTVINQFAITGTYDALIADGQIKPMIIAAIGIDQSFGMNTSDTTDEVITKTDKIFDAGRYEDYIMQEIIPHIEQTYSVADDRGSRYIGGYSMGGLAALHIAFRNPEMFSKVGGHSPTVFVEDFPDITVKEFLYPTEALRQERDPLFLAQNRNLSGLSIYLDTGITDVNVTGIQSLAGVLDEYDVPVETHLFNGVHGFAYCSSYMVEYLRFYGG